MLTQNTTFLTPFNTVSKNQQQPKKKTILKFTKHSENRPSEQRNLFFFDARSEAILSTTWGKSLNVRTEGQKIDYFKSHLAIRT